MAIENTLFVEKSRDENYYFDLNHQYIRLDILRR